MIETVSVRMLSVRSALMETTQTTISSFSAVSVISVCISAVSVWLKYLLKAGFATSVLPLDLEASTYLVPSVMSKVEP